MDNNMMNSLRQLGQMGENIQRMFGEDFMKKVMPNLQNMPSVPFQPGMNQDPSGLQNMFNWSGGQHPRADLYQTRNELIAVLEIPGLEKSADVKVAVEPTRLYVKGNYSGRYGGIPQDQFLVTERQRGEFEREIQLPVRVLGNKVRASYKQGLLEIRMIKDEGNKSTPKGNYVPVNFD